MTLRPSAITPSKINTASTRARQRRIAGFLASLLQRLQLLGLKRQRRKGRKSSASFRVALRQVIKSYLYVIFNLYLYISRDYAELILLLAATSILGLSPRTATKALNISGTFV